MQLTVRIAAFVIVLAFSALGQSPNAYRDLKTSLRLSNVQIYRLQRLNASSSPPPRSPAMSTPIGLSHLSQAANPWQQELDAERSLALAILTEEQRSKLAAAATVLQLENGAMQLVSVGAIGCSQWPGTCACFYPFREDYTVPGLSEDQLERFEQLRVAYRWPKKPEEIAASHTLVLKILRDEQKTRLAAFEADLRLVNAAMDTGLLTRPGKGESLCN